MSSPGQLTDVLTGRIRDLGEIRSEHDADTHLRTMGRGAGDGVGEDALAEPEAWDARDVDVAALCSLVHERLPWVSAVDGLPVEMRVIRGGFLDWDHPLHAKGTPFVLVGVDNWEAAAAVETALSDIAGLDDAAWDLDWGTSSHAFRVIQVFPSASI